MNHIEFALAHPVFDPAKQIVKNHNWLALISWIRLRRGRRHVI